MTTTNLQTVTVQSSNPLARVIEQSNLHAADDDEAPAAGGNQGDDMKTEPNDYAFVYGHNSLTKREFFAAMAMSGSVSSDSENWYSTPKEHATQAVQFADALIAELNKK